MNNILKSAVRVFVCIILVFSMSLGNITLIPESVFLRMAYAIDIIGDAATKPDNDVREEVGCVEKYTEGNSFSSIVIDSNENTISKDGGEETDLSAYGVDYDKVSASEPVIPKEAVEDMIVDNTPPEEAQEALESTGENFLPQESAQEEMPDFEYTDEGKIIITNKYQSKRLIVTTADGRLPKNTYGAIDSIKSSNGYWLLQYDSQEDTKAAYESLPADKKVESVRCDEVVKLSAAYADKSASKLIGSDHYKKHLKNEGKMDKEIIVAVVDSGVEVSHELLKGRTVKGYDIMNSDSKPEDVLGHGTHVAGIIADNTPSNVKIMPIKAMDDDGTGYVVVVAAAIDYAVKKGVDVINLSLGGNCVGDDCPIAISVKKAIKKGITVVVAAGNEGTDTKNCCPAGITQAITVAACEDGGNNATGFTNYGKSVDVTAPGSDIRSSVPGNSYEEMSGTSMAAPFVSAGAAMIIAEGDKKLSPSQVAEKIKETSVDMLKTGKDVYTGYGLLDFGKILDETGKATFEGTAAYEETVYVDWFSKAMPYRQDVRMITEGHPSDRSFKVYTSNSEVAVFDGSRVKATGDGTCIITMKLANGEKKKFNVVASKKEVWLDYAAKEYAGGKGTKDSPYIIKTAEQLAKFALDVRTKKSYTKKYYKLGADIDLEGKMWISAINTSLGYTFVGFSIDTVMFSGVFDGNYHTISNMYTFDVPARTAWGDNYPLNSHYYTYNTGFFSDIKGATVKNLGIVNGYNANEDVSAGLLAGTVFQGSRISNCFTTGFSVGNGLVGNITNYNIKVSNCYSSATVLCSGIAGEVYSSLYEEGTVEVSNCFFTGTRIYSNSKNIGTSRQGNVFGRIESMDTKNRFTRIYNCFATSEMHDEIGFAKSNSYGMIYDCYYSSKNSIGIEKQTTKKYTDLSAKSNSFFKSSKNFTNSKYWNEDRLWDFKNTWAIDEDINGGYPHLKKFKIHELPETKTDTWLDYAASKFKSGDGSKESPFIIETPQQLARMAKLCQYGCEGVYFKLAKDIDLSGHKWYPIGAGNNYNTRNIESEKYVRYIFGGHLDGDGHKIKNMTVSSKGDTVAFIAKAEQATVKNVTFENVNVKGNSEVASIVAEASAGVYIINCSVTGKVKATDGNAGGIAATASANTRILGITSDATVTATGKSGGIAWQSLATIENCKVTAKLSGKERNTGAIAAECAGIIKNTYTDTDYPIANDITWEIVGESMIFSGVGMDCEILSSYEVTPTGLRVFENYYGYETEDVFRIYLSYDISASTDKNSYKGFDFSKVWAIEPEKNGGMPYLRSKTFKEPTYPTDSWENHIASKLSRGKGTKSDPYLIATATELAYAVNRLRTDPKFTGKYFRLVKDIDLGGKLWLTENSVSYTAASFYFDGNGKTVSNLTGTNIGNGGYGLFPLGLEKGYIKNLHLKNVKGTNECGLLISNSGTIKNCSITGVIECKGNDPENPMGGMVANNFGTIEKCSIDAIVRGYDVDSLVGWQMGTVKNCYARGRVIGYRATSLHDCEANCYTTARINCFHGCTAECYFDSVASGLSYGTQDKFKLTPVQAKKKEFYEDLGFKKTWAISSKVNDGYPYLVAPETVKVNYNLNGGNLNKYSETEYVVGAARTLESPTRTGYTFLGWYKKSDFSDKAVTSIPNDTTGAVTLYAKWKANTYSVKYNANGGTGEMKTQTGFTYGKAKALAANGFKAPKGMVFKGWSKSKNGEAIYENRMEVKKLTSKNKATVTLYAVWEKAFSKSAVPTLKEVSAGKGTATLKWTEVTDESGYQIYYSTEKDCGFKRYGSVGTDTDSLSVKNLDSGKRYYFKVRAFKKNSSKTVYSSWSEVKSVKTM